MARGHPFIIEVGPDHEVLARGKPCVRCDELVEDVGRDNSIIKRDTLHGEGGFARTDVPSQRSGQVRIVQQQQGVGAASVVAQG